MTTHDFSAQLTRELYDQFRLDIPILHRRWTEATKLENPDLTSFEIKAAVIHRLRRKHPGLMDALRRRAQAYRRYEPQGFSPLWQISCLACELNPYGELTGGNYRSSL